MPTFQVANAPQHHGIGVLICLLRLRVRIVVVTLRILVRAVPVSPAAVVVAVWQLFGPRGQLTG